MRGAGSTGSATHHRPAKFSAQDNAKTLNKTRQFKRSKSAADLQCEQAAAGGGHHEKQKNPTIVTAAISAFVNWMLMFGLCSAYGIIMFEDHWNERHRGLGVKMNLCSALIVGLLLAGSSKIGGAIGGPDLNPVVFLGVFVHRIADSIAAQLNLGIPEKEGNRRLWEDGEAPLDSGGGVFASWDVDVRRLLGHNKGDHEFCTGIHYQDHPSDCDEYHNELRATAIFAVAVSSLLMGLLFFSLGHFKMTRMVSYVPTTIMEAFLSCVGYKVFAYALKICRYQPLQIIVAACTGVPLYFLKHVGNPAVIIPTLLLTPLAVFYAVVFAMGGNVASAREAGWMFDNLDNVVFYSVWRDGPANSSHINFKAWMTTIADLLVMVTMCLLDCMVKLSAAEGTLPDPLDKDYETQLYGIGNFITTLCGSSVGYMQPELNHVNFGIMGNTVDRRAGILYSLLCGVVLFWTTDVFNYVPRFFLSTLLFYQATGFVVENLWGSRKYLQAIEWLEIFVILAVFISTQSLLYAVVVGGLITAFTFIYHYAKIPCVAGRPRAGGEGRTLQRHSFLLQKKIQHIANSWLLVIHLKGYIFFGSAEKLIGDVIRQLEWQRTNVPVYQRLHWLIFDCEQLDGLDSSASKVFGKLAVAAHEMNLEILWSSAHDNLVSSLKSCGTIHDDKQVCNDLSDAKNSVENTIQAYIHNQQAKWLETHPLFRLAHEVMRERMALEPFEEILSQDMARFGVPWEYCTRMRVRAFSTLLWKKGERRKTLFLIHSGKVGLFTDIPTDMASGEWGMPHRVYGRGRLLDRVAFCKMPAWLHAVALEDGELLCWNEVQWAAMTREQPAMAASIMQAVLKQDEDEEEELMVDVDRVVGEPRHSGVTSRASRAKRNSHKGGSTKDLHTHIKEPTVPLGPVLCHRKRSLGEDLQSYLRPLFITRGLAELGLFQAPGNTATPAFTGPVVGNLDKALMVAYYTFKNGDGTNSSISADKVAEAMLYAGISGLSLMRGHPENLCEADFYNLGKELTMSAFSKKQLAVIQGLFGKNVRKGGLSRTEVVRIMRESVHSDMTVQEIEDVISFCAGTTARQINEDTFVAIFARLVRKYEREWAILVGIRQLIRATESEDLSDRLTPEMLVKNPVGHRFTLEEAQELLWSADFCEANDFAPGTALQELLLGPVAHWSPGGTEGLNIQMVLPALWPCEAPTIDLPPVAKRRIFTGRGPVRHYAVGLPEPERPAPPTASSSSFSRPFKKHCTLGDVALNGGGVNGAVKDPMAVNGAVQGELGELTEKEKLVASLFGGPGCKALTPDGLRSLSPDGFKSTDGLNGMNGALNGTNGVLNGTNGTSPHGGRSLSPPLPRLSRGSDRGSGESEDNGQESLDLKAAAQAVRSDGYLLEEIVMSPAAPLQPVVEPLYLPHGNPGTPDTTRRRSDVRWGPVEEIPDHIEAVLPGRPRQQFMDIRNMSSLVDRLPDSLDGHGGHWNRLHFARLPEWEKSDAWYKLESEPVPQEKKLTRRQSVIHAITKGQQPGHGSNRLSGMGTIFTNMSN